MSLELLKSKNAKAFHDAKPYAVFIENAQTSYNLKRSFLKIKIKSIFDKIIAFFGIVVLLPLFLTICIFIIYETKSFPIYRQLRTGLMGRPFKIWKFKTMYVCDNGYNITQTLPNDIRVTRLGRFLRRSSIDELPQLFNVLMGQMSLIGPRPHAIAHDIYYSRQIKNYELRYLVKPGMSGLAQICGFRGPTDKLFKMENRIQKDHEYIENWSLKLDFKILLKTFFCLNSQNAV